MKNIEHKSISELEGWQWKGEIPTYENDSSVVCTFYELHNKPLSLLSANDISFLIGQNSGLEYLIPIALHLLKENIFLEADYPGGLLFSLLRVVDDSDYWRVHPKERKQLIELYNNQMNLFEAKVKDYNIIKHIKSAFTKFLVE